MAPVLVDIVDDSFAPRVSQPHISYSQFSMYTRCSWQYKLRYIDGLKQRPALPIAIGKGGHAALEFEARHYLRTKQHLRPIDLTDKASDFIDIETDEVEDALPKDKGEAKDRALGALRIYAARDLSKVRPAGVEVEFNLDVNEPNVEPIRLINGKIDLIDTSAVVDDYKFVRQARTQMEVDLSPQLTLYGKVFHTITGKYPRDLGYRMFLPGSSRTSPDVRLLRRDASLMTPAFLEGRFKRLISQFREVERAIKAEVFIPVDDPKICSWCGYRDICQGTTVDAVTAAKVRGEIA